MYNTFLIIWFSPFISDYSLKKHSTKYWVHKQVIVFFPSRFFHEEQKVYGVNQYDRPFVLVCFLCIKECEVAGTANCGNFTEMLIINIIRFRKVYNISFKFMRTVWSNNYIKYSIYYKVTSFRYLTQMCCVSKIPLHPKIPSTLSPITIS